MSALIPQSNQSPSTEVGNAGSAIAPQGGAIPLPKISFREVFNAVLRWSWIPVACLLIGAIGLYVYVSTKPVFYTSYGSLNIKVRAPEVFSDNPLGQEDNSNLEQMKTVEQGLFSSTVLLRVAERNNLAADPLFLYEGKAPLDQAMLLILSKRINVELRKGSRLIDIQVEDSDPARAARMVEHLVEEYELWKDGRRSELVAQTSVGLASEEERLRKQMEESEAELREFRAENPVLGLSGKQDRLQSSKLETLNEELANATADRLRLEAQFRAMAAETDDGNATTLAARGKRGTLALNLENQVALKQAEFAKLKERYLGKHPKYIEADEELKRLKEQLAGVTADAKAALANDLAVARTREQELQQLVANAKSDAMNDEELRETFSQLTRAAEIDRGLHSKVVTRLQETQIGAALDNSFLSWEERPLVPVWPSGPNKKGFVLVGAFLGLVLGVGLALLLTLSDPKVREASAVERKLRLPLLARLPVYTRQVVHDLSVAGDGLATLNRPAHLARYTAAAIDEKDPMQTLLFASPYNGDGKTLCVMKCARTMVKQGYRTLVVDADFSMAGLSREYTQQRGGRHGLAAYLMGEAEPAEVLFETGLPGLWFLPTGALQTDRGELLSGPGLRQLLQAIAPMFDRVIFDMSSVLESDDVQAVTRFVDSTYLVAQKGKGKYRDLKETRDILQSSGGNLAGFIWNEGGRRRRRSDFGPVIEPVTYPSEVREVSPKGQNEPMPAPGMAAHRAI